MLSLKTKCLCLSALFFVDLSLSLEICSLRKVLVLREEMNESLKGSAPWQTFICSTYSSNKITYFLPLLILAFSQILAMI